MRQKGFREEYVSIEEQLRTEPVWRREKWVQSFRRTQKKTCGWSVNEGRCSLKKEEDVSMGLVNRGKGQVEPKKKKKNPKTR